MNNDIKKTKKKNIIIPCLLLIILILAALGITYLKFFYEDTSGVPIIPEQKLTPKITEELNKIVTNFNNDDEVKEKNKQNIKIKAELNKDTIKVIYEAEEETEEYNYKYNNMLLEVENNYNEASFKVVFKIMVRANQKRLNNNNTNEINTLVDQFLNNENEIDGLFKESLEANEITYNISIDKVIKKIEEKTEEDDLEG